MRDSDWWPLPSDRRQSGNEGEVKEVQEVEEVKDGSFLRGGGQFFLGLMMWELKLRPLNGKLGSFTSFTSFTSLFIRCETT